MSTLRGHQHALCINSGDFPPVALPQTIRQLPAALAWEAESIGRNSRDAKSCARVSSFSDHCGIPRYSSRAASAMPVHSGSFNKRRASATKERKIKERVTKKRQAVKQKQNSKKLTVSGRRTGKAARKLERAERKAVKQAVASREVDVDMADAADASQEA